MILALVVTLLVLSGSSLVGAAVLARKVARLEDELARSEAERQALAALAAPKLLPEVADQLQSTAQTETWCQPVFLLGPRHVGKTCLIHQWQVGEQVGWLSSSPGHQMTEIPVCDIELPPRSHFAAPSLSAPVDVRLKLRVHDFIGELNSQGEFLEMVQEETMRFWEGTQRKVGVVIVCVFDAAELQRGFQPTTRAYYESPSFKQLHRYVIREQVRVERLVVVFNKIDRLRASHPNLSHLDLREECRRFFEPYYHNLIEQCELPGEKVHFEVTMLDPEAQVDGTLNATRVLDHCARSIVSLFRTAATT